MVRQGAQEGLAAMDWTTVITGAVALISGGVVTRLVTLKSTRRKAGAEAESAAIEALKSAIGELREMQAESAGREDRLNDQIRERDAKIEELQAAIADKRCENTAKGYYMCVHQGCMLRRPSLGQGKEYYKAHHAEENFGADYYTVEELLEMRRNGGRGEPARHGRRPAGRPEGAFVKQEGDGNDH